MTEQQLKDLYIQAEHGTFTPIYTYDDFVFNEETEEYEYIGLVIQKTAQEVYEEWLANKENPLLPQPSKIDLLEQENKKLWDTVEYLLRQVDTGIPSEG